MKPRTDKQNKALHKYLEQLSDALNEAGYDMRKTLKESVDIPWNKTAAKEFLWRPIQEIVLDIESTTNADTGGYSKVYEVLNRHIQQKFGVSVPWPEQDNTPESVCSYQQYKEAKAS